VLLLELVRPPPRGKATSERVCLASLGAASGGVYGPRPAQLFLRHLFLLNRVYVGPGRGPAAGARAALRRLRGSRAPAVSLAILLAKTASQRRRRAAASWSRAKSHLAGLLRPWGDRADAAPAETPSGPAQRPRAY
jgi:hypothetical protein